MIEVVYNNNLLLEVILMKLNDEIKEPLVETMQRSALIEIFFIVT
jgi:hypothetical protein